ncbi:hypothetical protein Sango_2457900 [Sesamum angolense]|uniref:Serine aminopeptidase S33 domain-containing protein n=1 Tax=Sesamum angolense TaxID=2727404 RepID=A0AAE1W865_9LAMI|nr:hypothetical protein Sango_2457900 [Sesamum angolense]
MLKGKWYQRKDLEVVNSRGDALQCSHYMPIVRPEGNPLPCVIYCHGNSGCRTDASEAAIILLPSNITVFTLDFSGSGLSGGEHVTLGWNEKDDLKAVVDYLRADGNVSLIGLWGRSMGAVTSLMYGAEDPSIAGMVLDSPFSDLVDLMMELVDTYKVRLPKFTVKFAIQYMRRAIQKKAKFDIMDLNTIKVAKSCFVPVLFGHASDDDFIQPHHSDRIFDAYVGDKNIIKFEGDHNSPRPQFYFDSISIFFNNVLQPPEDEVGSTYFDLSHDYFPKGNWSTFHDLEYPDELLDSPAGPATSSTEDAIKQLRSRRPMSMIVVPADISSKDKQPDDQSHGSNVPASIDDDEYVEYRLIVWQISPAMRKKKKGQVPFLFFELIMMMLMEAVLESLKDLEVSHPQVKEPSSNGGNFIEPKPPAANAHEDPFSTQNKSMKTELVSTSAADEHKLVSEMLPSDPKEVLKCSPSVEVESQETSFPCDPSTCNHIVSDADNHSKEPLTVVKNPTSNDAVSDRTSQNGPPSGDQSSSEVDMADRTKVTVKVVKNPTNNIMDGLLRRWDLNFFRNR